MNFKRFYHTSNLLQESITALDQIHEIHNLKEFFSKTNSPYIMLQILAAATISLKDYPGKTLEEINANPSVLLEDPITREKFKILATTTRFANDFNLIYRTIFPESTGNPIEWAKKNRALSENLDSPEIKKILADILEKYNNIK
jgi:hypothetical protein